MANPSDKVVVKWVNDTRGRVCWVILASLCLCGSTQLMEVFRDESQVIYKSGSCLRSFVPLVFFIIIVITIYYHRTLGVSILTVSILFGVVALVQLLFPIDEFYVGYVMVIITLGIFLAYGLVDYDLDQVIPFGYIFSNVFLYEMIIVVINYPGNHRFFNRY
ncbi:hypothetical protein Bca52824_067493 [Brassica carinata]|uniref:Uncharacterized protein n=1 Tax=Brassica carinata TaxID=52824 RepID=A0A8X7QNG2_BRACI|nr:hypothetical protein Bca52824_067493 [Brassica carinata]